MELKHSEPTAEFLLLKSKGNISSVRLLLKKGIIIETYAVGRNREYMFFHMSLFLHITFLWPRLLNVSLTLK